MEFEAIDQASSALKSGPHFLFGKRLTLEYQKNNRAAAFSPANQSPAGTQVTEDLCPDRGSNLNPQRASPIKQTEKLRPKNVEGKPQSSSKKLLATSCRPTHEQPCFPLVTKPSANQNKGFIEQPEARDLDYAVERPSRQLQDTQRVPDSAFERSATAERAQKSSFTESRMQEFYRHLRERASNCSTEQLRPSLNNRMRESQYYRFNRNQQARPRAQNPPSSSFSHIRLRLLLTPPQHRALPLT